MKDSDLRLDQRVASQMIGMLQKYNVDQAWSIMLSHDQSPIVINGDIQASGAKLGFVWPVHDWALISMFNLVDVIL